MWRLFPRAQSTLAADLHRPDVQQRTRCIGRPPHTQALALVWGLATVSSCDNGELITSLLLRDVYVRHRERDCRVAHARRDCGR
eukprot:6187165-Prymnesium_polylepis.1